MWLLHGKLTQVALAHFQLELFFLQRFLNYREHQKDSQVLLKLRSRGLCPEVSSPRVCVPNTFPGDPDAAVGQGAML